MSVIRKMLLSPGLPATCMSCGESVVVTYRHWIKAALPGVMVMIIALFFESNLLMYGLSAVGFALMIWLQLRLVPLVKEKRD